MQPLSQFAGRYREWAPASGLRGHICQVWINELSASPAAGFLVIPDACVDILWTGESLCVAGPDTHPVQGYVPRARYVSGIRFLPGAAFSWLRVPLSELLNARIPLAEFWGRDARELAGRLLATPSPLAAARLIEEALLGRIARVEAPGRELVFLRAYAGMAHGVSETFAQKQLCLRMGVSERTLRRRCTHAFGYGFKTLQRILRFQRLFRLASESGRHSLTHLALEAGFADQAHMSREVRRLGGLTPLELVTQVSSTQRT